MAPQADVTGFSPNLAGMAPQPPQNTLQYLGQSSSLLDFIGRFVNRKQFQQQQNLQKAFNLIQMDDALSGAGAHGVIDHDAITKLLRKSGIPFTTDPQKLSQAMGAIAEEAGGQKTGTGPVGADPITKGVMGVPPGAGPGAGAMQAPQGAPPYVQKAVDMYNRVKASGKPVSVQDLLEMKLDVLSGRATALNNAKEKDELARAQFSENVNNMKNYVASHPQDDPISQQYMGRLHRLNEIPEPSVTQQVYDNFTDAQKQEYAQGVLGHELPETKNIREAGGAMAMVQSGMVPDLNTGLQVQKALDGGGDIPPELAKKIRPTTANIANQIALTGALQQIGLTPPQIKEALKKSALGVPLADLLPDSLQNFATTKLQLERMRLQVELARSAAALETAKGKVLTDEQKQDVATFQMLSQLKKDGGDISPEMLKAAQEKAARALGMSVTETPTFLNRITGGILGGTETKFTPQVSPEDQSMIDQQSGGGGGGGGAGGAPSGSTTTWTDAQGRVHTESRDTGQQPGRQPGAPGRSLAQRVIEKGIQYFQGQNQQQQAKYGTRGIKLPRTSSATAAAPAAGNVRVKFGPNKDSWIDFAPGDVIDADGNTIQTLRDVGWTDDEIAEKIKQSPPPAITPPASVGETP